MFCLHKKKKKCSIIIIYLMLCLSVTLMELVVASCHSCVPQVKSQDNYCFKVCGIKLWNGLPLSVKCVDTKSPFKRAVKIFLMNRMERQGKSECTWMVNAREWIFFDRWCILKIRHRSIKVSHKPLLYTAYLFLIHTSSCLEKWTRSLWSEIIYWFGSNSYCLLFSQHCYNTKKSCPRPLLVKCKR